VRMLVWMSPEFNSTVRFTGRGRPSSEHREKAFLKAVE